MLKNLTAEAARSSVRISVTYAAAGFLFIGGTLLITYLLFSGKTDKAVSLFMAIMPVTASIIAFWFGNRQVKTQPPNPNENEGQEMQGRDANQG